MEQFKTASGVVFDFEENQSPAPVEQRAAALSHPRFGTVFSDHMVRIDWTATAGWAKPKVVANVPISLSPAAAVLHYGQEIFEGMKAYRWADSSIWCFRPWVNAQRFARSAARIALPELDPAVYVASLEALMQVDHTWVPSEADTSLYLRPFMFASEAFVGVRPAREVTYLLIASPVGSYFPGGLTPVSIWVDTERHRAAPGGTGAAKCGGNYAASLVSQELAAKEGCEQVLFLDAVTGTQLEELGGMNVMVITADGTMLTPPAGQTVLEGVTRDSIMQLVRDRDQAVEERPIDLSWLLDAIRQGQVTEVLACGTAAVVTPIGRLKGQGFDVVVGDGQSGELTRYLHNQINAIYYGQVADSHGWTYRLH